MAKRPIHARLAPASLALSAAMLAGCADPWKPDPALIAAVDTGAFDDARRIVTARILETVDGTEVSDQDRADRSFILDQVRYAMIDLADGQYAAAETPFLAAYDLLRTAGINDDNTVNTFLGTEEGQRYWKGEPFEQAAAYTYFAAQLAAVDDWNNAAAAAANALFSLQDFEQTIEAYDRARTSGAIPAPAAPSGLTEQEKIFALAEKAQVDAYDAAIANGENEAAATAKGRAAFDLAIDTGYQPIETNFAPAYFMRALGRWAGGQILGEQRFLDDARDNFRKAIAYAPAVEPAAQAITAGTANTVFWVDWGRSPEKVRVGRSGVIAEYAVIDRSAPTTNAQPLAVAVNGSTTDRIGIAADFNDYALDHRWRSNQELRETKSIVGDAITILGIAYLTQADTTEEVLAAATIAIIGQLVKATAVADVRHIEILPQRSYFAAVNIEDPGTTVTLQIDNRPGTRLVLPGMSPPPEGQPLQFRYVRLPRTFTPPAWATSGRIVWANDFVPGVGTTGSLDIPGRDLPYIMGGRCVRTPTAQTLADYHAAGNLQDLSLTDLQNLYRAEGITWELSDQRGLSRTHILEGGTSLVAPPPGSVGFARLFCNPTHSAYVPLSDELRNVLNTINPQPGAYAGN